jgi:hypothetical protein
MSQLTEMLLTIAMGVIGVATLAIIISKNSNTAGVIQAAASGFGNTLGVAVSPVTGSNVTLDLSYPSSVNVYG